MTAKMISRSPEKSGFTLIELLVVVAIIALLISILLPSLGNARAQGRAAQCASRIAQMAKAILLYSEGFDETPPFLGRGWEDCDDAGLLAKEWPRGSGKTIRDWAMLEDWLMPAMPTFWMTPYPWPGNVSPKDGKLFPYTRFEIVYRCPEFERSSGAEKTQNLFNYTRTVLARRWFHKGDPEGRPDSIWAAQGDDNWCGQPGPVLKISQIHSCSQMQMFMDERWDKHCAAPVDQFQKAGAGILEGRISQQWMSIDCIFGPWGDELGQYHGARRISSVIPAAARDKVTPVKCGYQSFYDGHAETEPDPLPDRNIDFDLMAGAQALLNWLYGYIFGQRGLSPEQIIFDNPFG